MGAHTTPALLVTSRGEQGEAFQSIVPITGRLTLGRAPKHAHGDHLLLEDEGVADEQARIVFTPERELELIALAPGVYVKEHELAPSEHAPLVDGAPVFVGESVLFFRYLSGEDIVTFRDDAAAPLGPVPTMSRKMGRTVSELRRAAATASALGTGREPMIFLTEWGAGAESYAGGFHRLCADGGGFLPLDLAPLGDGARAEVAKLWPEHSAGNRGPRYTTILLTDVDVLPGDVQDQIAAIALRLSEQHASTSAWPRLLATAACEPADAPFVPVVRAFRKQVRVPGLVHAI
jgi:hypothetical protein